MKKQIIFFILTIISPVTYLFRIQNFLTLIGLPLIFWLFTIYYATKEKETTGQAFKTWFFYHIILLVMSIIEVFGLAFTTKGSDVPIGAAVISFGIPIIIGIVAGFAIISLIVLLFRRKISEINLKIANQGKKPILINSIYISLIATAIIEIILSLVNHINTVRGTKRFIDNIKNGLYYPQAFNDIFYFFEELIVIFIVVFIIVIFVYYIINYISQKRQNKKCAS